MNKCEYGCGRIARYSPRKGMKKWCCEKTYKSCPSVRNKMSLSHTGLKHSDETKLRIGDGNRGKIVFEETRRKMSISQKGRIISSETKEKMSNAKKGKCVGEDHPFYGKKHTKKSKEQMSKSQRRHKHDYWRGKKHSVESRNKMSKSHKELFKNDDYLEIYKRSMNEKPNKKEKKIIEIVKKLGFEFVGDFSFWLGGRNPDFVNFKKKQIIELFGDYWHSKKITNIENDIHEKDRKEYFQKFGYSTLIIWEHELLNKSKVERKINGFSL